MARLIVSILVVCAACGSPSTTEIKGEKGDPGAAGSVGPSGEQGLAGDTGATGSTGATGATGALGTTEPSTPTLIPSAAHMTLSCAREAVLRGASVDCTLALGDRNANDVQGAALAFRTEAGIVTSPAITDALGHASTKLSATGAMPSLFLSDSVNATKIIGVGTFANHIPARPIVSSTESVHNFPATKYTKALLQKAGQARIIAMTRGEEAFVDANANGSYDAGEVYFNVTEPFIDRNGNGVRDDCAPLLASSDAYAECYEDFVDANGNQVWDGANATWDADTVIWTYVDLTWVDAQYLDLIDVNFDQFAENVYDDTTGLPLSNPDTWHDNFVTDLDIGSAGRVTTTEMKFRLSDPFYNCSAFAITEARVTGIASVDVIADVTGCEGSLFIVEGGTTIRTGGGVRQGELVLKIRTDDGVDHTRFWPLALNLAP